MQSVVVKSYCVVSLTGSKCICRWGNTEVRSAALACPKPGRQPFHAPRLPHPSSSPQADKLPLSDIHHHHHEVEKLSTTWKPKPPSTVAAPSFLRPFH